MTRVQKFLAALPLMLMAAPVHSLPILGDGFKYPGAGGGGAASFPLEGETDCTTPSYSFTDDTNAGMCLAAANDLIISTTNGISAADHAHLELSSTFAHLLHYDATGNYSGILALNDKVSFAVNGSTLLQLGPALGSGLIVGKGGSTDAVARTLTAGTGISIANGDGQSGNPTISVDTAVTPSFSSGTAAASATGSVGTFYFETDAGLVSTWSATDTLATLMTTQTHLIDEDSFASDSNSKAPSQQSTKAYVDVHGFADPTQSYEFFEECDAGANTSGQFGRNGMAAIAISTGTFTTGTSSGLAANPWSCRMLSHATNDNSGAFVAIAPSGGGVAPGLLFDTQAWTLDAVVIPGSNGTAITSTSIVFGLGNAPQSVPASNSKAIWLIRDTDHSHTSFVAQICDASGANGCGNAGDSDDSASAASTVSISAGTAYRLRIENEPTGGPGGTRKISMRVNNETALTFCSSGCDDVLDDVPTGTAMTPFFQYLTRTTTGVLSGDLDYMHVRVNLGARY